MGPKDQPSGRRPWLRKRILIPVVVSLATGAVIAIAPGAEAAVPFPVASLDGSGNNVANPTWGQTGRAYSRVGATHYGDGISSQQAGPNARNISNRTFNDIHQNVFSERRVTQWGFVWGQFLDHTIGLRDSAGATATQANIPFSTSDPLETFTNNLGVIPFTRSAATAGTGTSTANPRQQTNTENSYVDAEAVYSGSNTRLDWLRVGSLDGNPANNQANLMMSANNYLPRATARGNASTAPAMDHDGRLAANPSTAMIAGDPRANENIALTATQTLFAREHNRIVAALPNTLSQEDKFQIARRIVVAEQQYITYQEFLPAVGVALPQYTGYKNNINATLSNEFATVGYRAHSQIHGEFELEVEGGVNRYSQATLNALEAQGVEVVVDGQDVDIAIPLGVAFFNPNLLEQVQLGPMLKAIGGESEYNNDEQIDNQLRSTLFQVPISGNPDCLDGPTLPACFNGVVDLAAIDIQRARDHGIGTYNQLRQAYGLPAKTSFTSITGEATDQFPAGVTVNSPNSLDVVALNDLDGKSIDLADPVAVANTGTTDVRRSTTAARLRGIYGNVNAIDAFVGMTAEAHVPGTEFGELQLAIWTREFQRLRDGDRFFFGNDQGLSFIRNTYGIDYKRTLAQIIASNTDIPAADLNPDVFTVPEADLPATTCSMTFTQTTSWDHHFQIDGRITNTGSTPINGWTLKYEFANGQQLEDAWGGIYSTSGPNGRDVTVRNTSTNATIPVGGSVGGIGFNANYDNLTNARPPNFSVNGKRCAVV